MLFKSRSTILLAAASTVTLGIGMGAGSTARANTVLLSNPVSGGAIVSPWTSTTALGGSVTPSGSTLTVGLAPASGEKAYVSASDSVGSLGSTATSVTYELQADINFANLFLTPNSSNTTAETLDVLQLFPVNNQGNNSEASAFLEYNPSSGKYVFQVRGNLDNVSGDSTGSSLNVTPAIFTANTLQHWDLSTTLTNNGNNNWTNNYSLTVTAGTNTWTASGTYTHGVYSSAFNPITNNNLVQVGDVLHAASTTTTPFLSGSYSISNFSDTLIGGSSIPEPATLGLMAVAGAGLLLVSRKRKA